MLLASLVASHPISSTQCSTRESSVQKELTPDVYEQQQVSEDVVPDIADAMAELEMTEIEKDKKEQEKVSFHIMLSIPQLQKTTKDIITHQNTSKDLKRSKKILVSINLPLNMCVSFTGRAKENKSWQMQSCQDQRWCPSFLFS